MGKFDNLVKVFRCVHIYIINQYLLEEDVGDPVGKGGEGMGYVLPNCPFHVQHYVPHHEHVRVFLCSFHDKLSYVTCNRPNVKSIHICLHVLLFLMTSRIPVDVQPLEIEQNYN